LTLLARSLGGFNPGPESVAQLAWDSAQSVVWEAAAGGGWCAAGSSDSSVPTRVAGKLSAAESQFKNGLDGASRDGAGRLSPLTGWTVPRSIRNFHQLSYYRLSL